MGLEFGCVLDSMLEAYLYSYGYHGYGKGLGGYDALDSHRMYSPMNI